MKILIIRLSSIGDIVLTQPIAAALRQNYPAAQIDFVTKPAYHTIVEKFGCVDNIIFWEESLKSLKKIYRNRYDLCVDLHAKLNTLLIRLFVRAQQTAVYNKKHLLRKKIVAHKTSLRISSTLQLYYSALKKLNIPFRESVPRLYLNEEKLSAKTAEIKIGIFPGALHKTKQYPPAKMAELIELFPPNWRIYLLGSSAESNLAQEIASRISKDVTNLCGQLGLDELVYQIAALDFIISNDSGPMHIAAALEKPQLAIFGATDPALGFAPLNPQAIVINRELECKPCSLHGSGACPLGHLECLQSLDNKAIYAEVKKKITAL